MKRVQSILPLLLLLIVVVTACGTTASTGAKGVPTWSPPGVTGVARSITPLRTLDDTPFTYCTAFSINEHLGYWMTAKHCDVPEGTAGPLQLPTRVVYTDPTWDIQVVQSMSHAPALVLGPPPSIGDMLYSYGYGYRGPIDRMELRTGQLVGLAMGVEDAVPSSLALFQSVPGDSGGPVLDARGRLVGVLWGYSTLGGYHIHLSWVVPYGPVAAVYLRYAKP